MIGLDAMGTLLELEAPGPLLKAELAARGVQLSLLQASYAMRSEIRFYRDHHDVAADAASLAALRNACADVLRRALEHNHVDTGALTRPEMSAALLAALRFRPYPEVPAALAAARAAGHRLVVVSNWDVSLHEVLEQTGLRALVDGVVTSAEAGATKPAPEIFARALALAGAPPAESWHVGDTLREDVAGARAAGIRPVLLVRSGAAGVAPDAVAVITSLTELGVACPYPHGP